MRRAAAALLALVLLVTGVPRVEAQPAAETPLDEAPAGSKERGSPAGNRAARAHFLRAEKAFNLAKFTEALAAYEAAYEVRPLPGLLFNIAQCHRNLGDHERAIFFYRRYLTLEPRSKNRDLVLELIAEQEQEQDRERAARAALAAPAPPPPPPPTVPVTLGPEADASATAPPPLYRRWWVWAAAGAVAVGVTAALLYPREGPLPRGQLDSVDRR
jgi:tetratricopeptide (TPR) repeat protein